MADAKSEKAEVARTGGKAQPNSGRGTKKKGDATLYPFCYDVKEYEKGYTVSKDNWQKVCTDAMTSGMMEPAIQIVLGETQKTRLWVISDSMFEQMREAWVEKYGE